MLFLENTGMISKPGDAGSWERVEIVAILVDQTEENPGALLGESPGEW